MKSHPRVVFFATLLCLSLSVNGNPDVCVRETPRKASPSKTKEVGQRIQGGTPAPDGRYPFVHSLWEFEGRGDRTSKDKFRFFCGGALIDPHWVLTAASCVDLRSRGVVDPGVFGGSNLRNGPFTELSFSSETFIHPEWLDKNAPGGGFDIALVRLPCPSLLPTVTLPPKDISIGKDDSLWAVGWGRATSGGEFFNTLQEVKLPLVDTTRCNFILQLQLAPSILCAGQEGGELCHGDSGGPLLRKGATFEEDVVVGIATGRVGKCTFLGKPSIFTSVSSVRDWIDKTMEENEPPEGLDIPIVKPMKKDVPPEGPDNPIVKPLEPGKGPKADPKTKPKPKLIFGRDIVRALKEDGSSQKEAASLIKKALDQDRGFAISGGVRIAAKKGLIVEMSEAIIEAVQNGVDEKSLEPALDLAVTLLD